MLQEHSIPLPRSSALSRLDAIPMNKRYIFHTPTVYASFWLILCLIVLFLLSSCNGSSSTLTGTITDAYTGEPVATANVAIGRTRVSTDANGMYATSRWRKNAVIEVSASGYELTSIDLETQPEIVQTDVPTVTLDASLRPNTLSGRVSSSYSGDAIEGAIVIAELGSAQVISATTAADGQYRLEGVPEKFQISIDAVEHSPIRADINRLATYDIALRPDVLTGIVTDQFSGEPLEGVQVTAGSATATTDADGRYRLEGIPSEVGSAEFSVAGYATVSQALDATTEMDAVLRSDVLAAVLVDQETGEPVQNATIIATETLTGTDVAFTRIDNRRDGSFTLEGLPEEGYVQVLAPGYYKAVLEIKPGSLASQIELEPLYVKALYVTAGVAASPSLLEQYLDVIDQTELNAIIIDLKSDMRDDLGVIYYDSQVPIVQELETSIDYMDVPAILAEAKKRGIYTIARVQVFSHDNALADARPEWAIQDPETGEVFADYPGPGIRYAWLDPWNRNVWDYNIQLSIEAAQLGFDEINFDYIRYPDFYGDKADYGSAMIFSQPTDPANDPDAMYQNLATFMEQSHRAINGAGAFFSIDVFGRVMVVPSMPIAQNIELMAPHADYIAPMIYPSLWWGGYQGFENPTAHPYEVILGSLEDGYDFFAGKRALLRPWLQDHTDPWQGARVVQYGPAEVRAQIDATHDFGKASGWMLYDSANTYTEEALEPASQP